MIRISVAAVLALSTRGALAEPEQPAPPTPTREDRGDLFPGAGHPTVSAASGLPFLGIAEIGVGITDGIAIGAIGGVTPSVLTAGIRPRFLVRVNERFGVLLVMPMLWYPKASAPGPGNIGSTSWVLTRPELMLDTTVSTRLHIAGGMGIIAAASIVALGNKLEGKEFAVPAYNGLGGDQHGFAGGVWNTVCGRTSYAFGPQTHFFAETSLVLMGVRPADNVGGPPFVATIGMQHSF